MKIKLSLLLLSLTFIVFTCCKDDEMVCMDPSNPLCENYDPCYAASPANADFIIFDSLDNQDGTALPIEIDTMWHARDLHFRALHDCETYEWQVGTDPTIYNTRYFELYFGSNVTGDVSVRLITTKLNTEGCLEESELRDTMYKSFHLIEYGPNIDPGAPIYGDFTGYDEHNPDETYTIKIVSLFNPLDHGIYYFPNNTAYCDPFEYSQLKCFVSYRAFVLNTDNQINCDNPKGIGKVLPDNKTLIIDYTTLTDSGERSAPKRFIGIKD